jgi:hypothetical protein
MKFVLEPSYHLNKGVGDFHSATFEIHAGSTAEICRFSDEFALLNHGVTELCGGPPVELSDDLDIRCSFF